MKTRFIGFGLISIMLSLLLVFPFLGTFLPGGAIDVASDNQGISPFFLKNEQAPIVFVYFGYVGCSQTCTPSLEEIAKIYPLFKTIDPRVKVYFINLNPVQSSDAPDVFAKGFHPDFQGVYASEKQIHKMSKIYNLSITKNEDGMGCLSEKQ